MTEGAGEATPLEGLAAEVKLRQVNSLLLARATQILEPTHEDHDLAIETIRGVTTEVVPIVGRDPKAGSRRDLAVWAITVGTAAQLEAALFPEQQGPGDLGRANILDRRYRTLLEQLRGAAADAGTEAPSGGPRASFPPSPAYPDPARSPYGVTYPHGGW